MGCTLISCWEEKIKDHQTDVILSDSEGSDVFLMVKKQN
jgi:hypothetical protein